MDHSIYFSFFSKIFMSSQYIERLNRDQGCLRAQVPMKLRKREIPVGKASRVQLKNVDK